MVLEHRHGRGGIGGERETQTEKERRRNGKVESWSAVVPLDQTMMGLYYQAMLPVSSHLKQELLSLKWRFSIARAKLAKQDTM